MSKGLASLRVLLVVSGSVFCWSAAGCGAPPDDAVESQASALTGVIVTRPIADDPTPFPDCCNGSWTVQPAIARFDAVNEVVCNNDADYMGTGIQRSPGPFWSGAGFTIDVAPIPVGATITSVRAVVCARVHWRVGVDAHFDMNLVFWGGTNTTVFFPGGSTIPGVGLFTPNPFQAITLNGSYTATGGNPGPKPLNGRMVLDFFGDNVDVSQIYFSIGYTM